MNIQQIDYVLAVNELKSFSKAAAQCFIGQPTLSTMIAKFEDEIEIKIFDRSTKPISITKEGIEIIRQLKIIKKEIENLAETKNALKGQLTGTLKIGIIPTVATYLLPLFLKEFIQQFPDIYFTVSELTTAQIAEQIHNRSLDIGIISIPLKDKNLLETPLFHEPFLLYDMQNKKQQKIEVANIDTNRLWLLEEGHCMRTQVNTICEADNRNCHNNSNLEYKSGSINTLLKFVKLNDGLTLIPYLSALEMSDQDQKRLYTFKEPVPVRSIGMITHKHFVKKQILQLLQAAIQQKVQPLMKEINLKEHVIDPMQ